MPYSPVHVHGRFGEKLFTCVTGLKEYQLQIIFFVLFLQSLQKYDELGVRPTASIKALVL
jgi:hypothetical protein